VSFRSFIVFGRMFLLLLMGVTLFGCATAKTPLTGLVPGRDLETVQSAVTLSAVSGEHSTAGRGYLIFKAPALFHLAILSPFGQTVLEAFSDNDRFTCVVPSKQTAYAGFLSDLPDNSVLKSLDLLKWVMAPAPLPVPVPAAKQKFAHSGVSYYFDEIGMLERKVSQEGDEVVYEGYRTLGGIAFPDSIVIRNRYGATVRIVFDEPQVNAPVEGSDLTPDLSGMTVLPLAEFKGM